MPQHSRPSSLSLVNYITGISDGLILPVIPCVLLLGYHQGTVREQFVLFSIIAVFGALVYGVARYLGEKEEIGHHHPQMGMQELEKDKMLLEKIGIEEQLVTDMLQQVGREQEQWLQEIKENGMNWDAPDPGRAPISGLQTGAGFLAGSFLITLPFFSLFTQHLDIIPCLAIQTLCLFLFGWLKGRWIGKAPLRLAMVQVLKGLLVIGLLAALLGITSPASIEGGLIHLQ